MNRSEAARLTGLRNRKHGHAASRSPTYRSWECMKSRCNNPADPSFPDYGGRGICVTSEWDEFSQFLVDMGDRPRGMTLDRIDVNRDYEPENCRWSGPKAQGRNKRTNRIVQFLGKQMTLVELAEATGVPYQRLHERIVRRGWDVPRAVAEPARGFR
jgi:hypothetical protein